MLLRGPSGGPAANTAPARPPQSRYTSHVCPLTARAKAGGRAAAAGILRSLLAAEALKPCDHGAVG